MIRYREVAPFLAAWSLLVMPALCEAGILTHKCACDASVRCEPATDCEHRSGGCGHEDNCSDDPCSRLTIQYERHTENTFSVVPIMAVPISLTRFDTKHLPVAFRQARSSLIDGAGPFCPAFVLPLLI